MMNKLTSSIVSTQRVVSQRHIDASGDARQLTLDTFLMALEEVRKEAPRGTLRIFLSVERE
jgi:hypothetical protein